jgi:hypothetical protein
MISNTRFYKMTVNAAQKQLLIWLATIFMCVQYVANYIGAPTHTIVISVPASSHLHIMLLRRAIFVGLMGSH